MQLSQVCSLATLRSDDMDQTNMDRYVMTKNTIDVRQDEKEVVVPIGGKKPGMIFGNFGKSTNIVVLRQV